jgi:hypothetical protein
MAEKATMEQLNKTREESIYRLLLISRDLCGAFGQVTATAISLPRLRVSVCTRLAGQIQRVVSESWGIDVLILDFLKDSNGLPVWVVAIPLSHSCPKGLTQVNWERLPLSELDYSQRKVIDEICAGHTGDRGPFSRIDWIEDAKKWIAEETGRTLPLDAGIEQHNAGGRFALLRVAAPDGLAYWLKATGEPNLNELDITLTLAGICPGYLPRLIATRRDWNAWLMEEAGEPLDPSSGVSCENAALAIAEIQRSTIGHVQELLTAGATDQRLEVLRERVGKFIVYLEEAMEQQTSINAPRLPAQRLREIGSILGDACAAMEALGIPDTVMHNDLNCGNILVRDGRCVLTDWSEASVGNPFINFQGLLLLLPRDGDCVELTRSQLMQAYKRCWLDRLEPWIVDRAFQLMPLLAIYSHLYGRGVWVDSARGRESDIQAYARSLARVMDREASSADFLEALCH